MIPFGRLLLSVSVLAGALSACGVGQMHGHYSEARVGPAPPRKVDGRCLLAYQRHLEDRIPANATVYVAAPRVNFARGRILVLWPDGRFVLKPDGRMKGIPCGNVYANAAPGEWIIYTGTYVQTSRQLVLTGRPLPCRRSRDDSARRIAMAVVKDGLKDSHGVSFRLHQRVSPMRSR